MDLEFFFFKLGPAIQFIFQIGYIPQESDFKELTPELYESFSMKASEEDIKSFSGHKIYAILPDDQQVWNRMVDAFGENLMILNEEEIEAFTRAAKLFDRCCSESGKDIKTMSDKLVYMARTLPSVFTEDTPYAIYNSDKK